MIHPTDKFLFGAKSRSKPSVSQVAAGLAALVFALASKPAEAFPGANDALVVELRRPSEQLAKVLDLFSETAAKHPAAALAAWKNGQAGQASLGKGTEALIALLNPDTIAELGALEGGRGAIGYDDDPRAARWRIVIPKDDGTFEAFATALALTDGRTLEPLRGLPVRQLGKNASPLAIADGHRVVFGSSLEQLDLALDPRKGHEFARPDDPGLLFHLDPAGLANASTLSGQRIRAALEGLGAVAIDGRFLVENDAVEADWTMSLKPEFPESHQPIALEWLEGLPSENALAAFATPIETDPKSLERLFAMADGVEKADPAFKDVAPLRVRLNLLGAAAGVRPERDIWPKLRGVSASFGEISAGKLKQLFVGLHAVDPKSAEELASKTLPKLLRAAPGAKSMRVAGQQIALRQAGSTLWIGWGEGALDASVDAINGTKPSVGRILGPLLSGSAPRRLAALWPGSLPETSALSGPLAKALTNSPPILWRADSEGTTVRGRIVWKSLRGTLQHWLDGLPLVPPPDRPANQ